MYHEGQGVEKDWIEAYAWFKLAARDDNETANLNITIFESRLDEDDLNKAKEKFEIYKALYKKKDEKK